MRASIGVRFNVGVLLSIPLHPPRGACVPHPKKTTTLCISERIFSNLPSTWRLPTQVDLNEPFLSSKGFETRLPVLSWECGRHVHDVYGGRVAFSLRQNGTISTFLHATSMQLDTPPASHSLHWKCRPTAHLLFLTCYVTLLACSSPLLLTFAGALALATAAINTTAYFSYLRAWLHTIDNRDFNSVALLGVLLETLVHILRWVLFHSVFVQLLGENSDRSPMRDGMPLNNLSRFRLLARAYKRASGSTWRRRADRDRSPSRAFGQLARKLYEKHMLSWGSASAYEVGVLPTQHISNNVLGIAALPCPAPSGSGIRLFCRCPRSSARAASAAR